MKKAVFIMFILVSFISCEFLEPNIEPNRESDKETKTKQPIPVASFDYSPIQPFEGQSVSFTNTSKNATSYSWDFGNGKKSTEKNPKLTFDAGVWTVSLIASNSEQKNGVSKTVNVKKKPTKIIISNCQVKTISFQDNNGRYWDDSSSDGPDIFIDAYNGNSNVYTSQYTPNVTSKMLPFNIYMNWTITNLTSTYTLKMYDYDTWFDDWMCNFTFIPKNYIPQYPSTIELKQGVYTILLNVKWE